MFKRAGAAAPIALVLATASVMALAVAPVGAKPSRTTTVDETSACHFTVEYAYSGVGGGSGLTMTVILYRQPAGTTDWYVVGAQSSGTFSGNGAAIADFQFSDAGQSSDNQYFGYGYLHKGDRTIHNSAAFSPMTAAETCG